jgi:cohesin complex subunit SA-1/2
MRDFVNFVLRCAGCDLEVTTDDIEDQDNVTGKLSDLQEEFQAVSAV